MLAANMQYCVRSTNGVSRCARQFRSAHGRGSHLSCAASHHSGDQCNVSRRQFGQLLISGAVAAVAVQTRSAVALPIPPPQQSDTGAPTDGSSGTVTPDTTAQQSQPSQVAPDSSYPSFSQPTQSPRPPQPPSATEPPPAAATPPVQDQVTAAVPEPPPLTSPVPKAGGELSQEAVKKLLEEEEERRRKRKKKQGRIRELEEIRAELAEKELVLLEKEQELLARDQTLQVLQQELEIERKLRALLTKEKEKAEETAALAMGLCTGGAMLP